MALTMYNDRIDKILPGSYVNVSNGKPDPFAETERGIAFLPLIGLDYGPAREVIEISNRFPDQMFALLGHRMSETDNPNIRLVSDALMNAAKVKCWIPAQGTRAEAGPFPSVGDSGASCTLTAKARYGGTRGNDLSFSIAANPLGGFDVKIFLEAKLVEQFERIKSVEGLILEESKWIEFDGSGPLEAMAGVRLTGGTTPETTNADLMDFADALDTVRFTTVGLPINGKKTEDGPDNTALLAAIKAKIKHLRNDCGRMATAVVANYAGNYEAITNITNGYVLTEEGYDIEMPAEMAVGWITGLECASTNVQSNTWVRVPGATRVFKPKTIDQQQQSILDGELFFTLDDDDKVIICKDINSLVDFEKPNDESYSHNRIVRVIDTLVEAIRKEFRPNRFSVNETGFNLMDALGAAILEKFEREGAIQNVNTRTDFKVDRVRSTGDRAYFKVGVCPVDSAEKLYFDVKTL